LKIIQNQAPLPLFFMHINEDEDQAHLPSSSSSASSSWPPRKTDQHPAHLPLHEISKDRSASSSTASSWTPMKIKMNLKP